MDAYRYFYLALDAVFLAVWLVIYLCRSDLRRKLLTMSLVVAPFGVAIEFLHHRDYWHPQYVFGIGGVSLADLLGGLVA